MTVVVEATGPLLLVQDRGRVGAAHLGVPPSGALDPEALGLANRLVGNQETAAGLEVLLGGVRLRAECSTRLALVGAPMPLRVAGRAAAWGQSVSVRAGDTIELEQAPSGLRGWLALAGGVDVPMALGSRSTDVLTGLGPEPLRAGDRLALGAADGEARVGTAVPAPTEVPPVTLPVLLGPRDDWFRPDAIDGLFSDRYVVSSASDRTAVRLDGPPVRRRVEEELPSEGLVTGAVQVPPDGRPLVFLNDHPVTGGYPVVAVVERAALARCAQLRPGEVVAFRSLRRGAPRQVARRQG